MSDVDAVVLWNNGKAYFFRGAQYVRYDVASDQADQEPRAIADGWPGVSTDGVDAVVLWNNGKAYFFRGAQYVRYDVASDQADQEPRAIADGWPGVSTDGVDAVVLWNNGKAHFFRGAQYVRYDVASDRTDEGYPNAIASAGLGAGAGALKGATGPRDQVLAHARSMMAEPRIAAKRLEADGTRVGWEKLEQIFEVAAAEPGVRPRGVPQ